jgi:hypothetical protein
MSVGRVTRGILSVAGFATAASTAAYLVSRPRATALPDPHAFRIAQLEKRLADLERGRPPVLAPVPVAVRPAPVEKPYAVTHYETLASQVAQQREIAELQRRLAAIERYPRA